MKKISLFKKIVSALSIAAMVGVFTFGGLRVKAADYIESKNVLGLVDVTTQMTTAALLLVQNIDDTDVIGSTTIADVFALYSLEDETHASEHNVGGADLIDRLFEGATEATIVTTGAGADTDGIVVSKGLYNTTGLTIVFDDFVDGVDGDHSDFNDGDYFGIYMNVATAGLDCSSNANMMCNAGTDFTGSATDVRLVVFQFRESVAPAGWYALNLNSGFSDPNTMAARIKMVVTAISGNDTLEADEQYNGRVFVSAASVLNAAGVVEGMEVVIVAETDSDVDFNPDNADTITLNGVALAQGDAVRITDFGDIIVCTGTGATTWSCSSDNGTDVN